MVEQGSDRFAEIARFIRLFRDRVRIDAAIVWIILTFLYKAVFISVYHTLIVQLFRAQRLLSLVPVITKTIFLTIV